MLWELEPRVLDKSAMPLHAYRLRPTRLCIQTNNPWPQAALILSRQLVTLTIQAADDPALLQSSVSLSMVPFDSIFSGESFLRVPGPENPQGPQFPPSKSTTADAL